MYNTGAGAYVLLNSSAGDSDTQQIPTFAVREGPLSISVTEAGTGRQVPSWDRLHRLDMPVLLMAATGGVWLFYIQHQFEETHWSEQQDWNFQQAALHGSSHYDLPVVLRWFTGNIGIHHVHHLSSKVPFYRLPEVLEHHPELREMGRITFFESLRCVKLVLWDEQQRRLVSFREARLAAA